MRAALLRKHPYLDLVVPTDTTTLIASTPEAPPLRVSMNELRDRCCDDRVSCLDAPLDALAPYGDALNLRFEFSQAHSEQRSLSSTFTPTMSRIPLAQRRRDLVYFLFFAVSPRLALMFADSSPHD